MKRTLIALFALSGFAMADSEVIFAGSGDEILSLGVTRENVVVDTKIVAVSTPETSSIANPLSVIEGNFYAGDYTVSIWVATESLKSMTAGNQVLFAYSGNSASSSFGCNAIQFTYTGENSGTLTIGTGALAFSGGTFTNAVTFDSRAQDKKSVDITFGDGSLTNITVAVTGASHSQAATVYVNGKLVAELEAYDGNMNGYRSDKSMYTYLNSDVKYGEVTLANEKKDIDGVVELMNIPEPATATLSLLALAGLAARRRRK